MKKSIILALLIILNSLNGCANKEAYSEVPATIPSGRPAMKPCP
jgi:hypothetical protein